MRLFGSTAFPVVQHDLSCAAFKALQVHQTEEPTFYHFAVSRPYRLLAVVLTTLADAAKYFVAGARVVLSERKVTLKAQERFTKSRQYLILVVTTLAVGMLIPDYLIELRSRFQLDEVANIERRKAWIKIPPQVATVSKVALGCLVSVVVAYVVYRQAVYLSRLFGADVKNPWLGYQFNKLKQEYSLRLSWLCHKDDWITYYGSRLGEDYQKRYLNYADSSWYQLVEFAQKYPAFWSELPEHPSKVSLKDWCPKVNYEWCSWNEKCAEPPIATIKPGLQTDSTKIQAAWESALSAYNSKKETSAPKDGCDCWHNKGYPTDEWLKLFTFVTQYPSYRPQLPYKGFVDSRDMSWMEYFSWQGMCNPRE